MVMKGARFIFNRKNNYIINERVRNGISSLEESTHSASWPCHTNTKTKQNTGPSKSN